MPRIPLIALVVAIHRLARCHAALAFLASPFFSFLLTGSPVLDVGFLQFVGAFLPLLGLFYAAVVDPLGNVRLGV